MAEAAANIHEEEPLGKLYDARAARRLLRYLKPYRRLVIVALGVTIAVNLVRQLGPLITKWAIDDYVTPATRGSMPPAVAFDGIFILSIVYLVSLLVTLVIGYFQDVLLSVIGQRVMFDLRAEIFAKLQHIELAFYDKNPVGRLMTRLTTDVDSLNELFTSGLVEVLGDLVLVVAALGEGGRLLDRHEHLGVARRCREVQPRSRGRFMGEGVRHHDGDLAER
jgi:ATP-binding cassette subfamily B protein